MLEVDKKVVVTEVGVKTINGSSKSENELMWRLLWGIVFTSHAEALTQMLGPFTSTWGS